MTDIASTEPHLQDFDKILETIEFYIKGANTKLVNAVSGDEISLDAVCDKLVFWGGSAGEGLILAPNPTVIDAEGFVPSAALEPLFEDALALEGARALYNSM